MKMDLAWQKVLEARKRLHGWTFEEKSRYLFDYVLQESPRCVVEIGVWKGLSLASFCAAAECLQNPPAIHAVDPWSEKAMDENGYGKMLCERQAELDRVHDEFISAFMELGLDANLKVHRMTSWDASFCFNDGEIDILHLDGAHTEWDSCRYTIVWTPKIKDGGLFVMDDANWDSMKIVQSLALKKFEHVGYLENLKTRIFKKIGK